MVQGQTKGLSKQKGGSSARHAQKAAAAPKKGKRYIAPKKAAAAKQAAMHKVCLCSCLCYLPYLGEKEDCVVSWLTPTLQELSAKINKSIEQQVAAAASSGKLTIMKNVAMEG